MQARKHVLDHAARTAPTWKQQELDPREQEYPRLKRFRSSSINDMSDLSDVYTFNVVPGSDSYMDFLCPPPT